MSFYGSPQSRTAEEWVNLGASQYREGNYDLAKEAFSNALAVHPGNAVAFENRGRVNLLFKEYQLALADAERTIALASKMKSEPVSIARTAPKEYVIRSRELRAMCYLALKDYQRAFPECDYVLRQTDVNDRQFSSPRIRHYLMRGIAYGGLAHYQEALEDFAHVTDVCSHPEKYRRIFEGENCGVVPYYRGDVYLGFKEYCQAISDYDFVLINLESWRESHKHFLLMNPYIDLPDFNSVRSKRAEAQRQL